MHGVHQRRRRTDRTRLAAAFRTDRVVRAGRDLGRDRERRQIVRARQRIVHQAAGQQLPALRIVDAVLEQGLPDALRKTAVHLPLDDHRIDDVAEIVAGGELRDHHYARVRIDLHLADMRARREREVRRIVERGLVQAGLELVERIVVRNVRRQRDLAERLAAIGASDGELAVGELDVAFRGLEQMRRDLLALGDDLVHRLDDRRAPDGERARAVGSHAERNAAGVAMDDVDVLDRNAETPGDELRERRLVTLTVTVRAGEHADAAGRMHAHLARLVKACPRP